MNPTIFVARARREFAGTDISLTVIKGTALKKANFPGLCKLARLVRHRRLYW